MNFLLASDDENAEKHVEIHSCFYCKKGFDNQQTLGGHLRAHQEEINARRSWNYPVHSSNFNASKYFENNAGDATSQFITSPNLSSSSGHAKVHHSNPLSSSLLIPFGSTATTGFPMDSSLYSGLYGICQFNTDELRTFRDGTPFSSRDALPKFQHHNLSKLSYPVYSIRDLDFSLGSNQLPGLKESKIIGSLPPGDSQCLGQNGVDKYNESSMLTREEGKKRCLDEVLGNSDIMNSSKRPQISSNLPAETEKPKKKELLLFKDVEDSFSGLGISFDDKKEDEADLDLSLHL